MTRNDRPSSARPILSLLGAAIVLAAVLGLAGCGTQEARLAAVIPESGSLAPYGRQVRRGMDVALAELNAKGGVLKGTELLAVTYVDDGSDAARAAEEIRSALDGSALAVIGPLGDEAFVAARDVSDETTGAILSPYASANVAGVGTSSLFRIYPSASLEMGRLVALLRKELFVKDVVIFSSRSTTGRAFKAAFQESFEHLRGTVQATSTFEPGLTREAADALVAELRTKPGDAALLLCAGDDAAQLMQALAGIDYVGEVFTTSAFHHPQLRQAAGAAAEDAMYVAPAFDPKSPAARDFAAAYEKAHGEAPDVWAALGHDAVTVLAAAIDDAGGLYGDDLPPTLRSSRFRAEGVLGATEFDASGDIVVRDLEVHGIHDGQPLGWDAYRPLWEARQKPGAR